MKRLDIVLLVVLFLSIFFISLASMTLNLLSPFDGSNISVIVDGDPPLIDILSPGSTSYNNATPLLINYTVFDHSFDSAWYSLNFGNNVSLFGETYVDLAEGNYILRIYANDSFGRENFSEVVFDINNSVPYCGDLVCSGSEDCDSCSVDCGSCPAPGGEGGGAGGGGAVGGTPYIPPIENGTGEDGSATYDGVDEKGSGKGAESEIPSAGYGGISYPSIRFKINWMFFAVIILLVVIFIILFLIWRRRKEKIDSVRSLIAGGFVKKEDFSRSSYSSAIR